MAGIRPETPPKRVIPSCCCVPPPRVSRGSRVGSYVVREARTPTIRAFFIGNSGGAAMLNREVRARRQARPQVKLPHSPTASA